MFYSALIAAQQLSVKIFSGEKNGVVDDIHIARGIVRASRNPSKMFSGFFWSFQDEGVVYYSSDDKTEEPSDTKESSSYFDFLFCNFNLTTEDT